MSVVINKVKISELPLTQELKDDDLFVLSQDGATKVVLGSTIKDMYSDRDYVDDEIKFLSNIVMFEVSKINDRVDSIDTETTFVKEVLDSDWIPFNSGEYSGLYYIEVEHKLNSNNLSCNFYVDGDEEFIGVDVLNANTVKILNDNAVRGKLIVKK